MTDSSTFSAAFDTWLKNAQAIVDLSSMFRGHVLTAEHGRRYIRIVQDHSAFAFIDKTNGNVLKPETWKKPSPIPRGSIYGDRLGVDEFGGKYLR